MCRIDRAAITTAEQWITERRRGWEDRLDRLGDRLGDRLDDDVTSQEQP